MSSGGENKTLTEESEEVATSEIVNNDMQNANEAKSDAFRRITRSMTTAKEKTPTDQTKVSKGLNKPDPRMVVLALPAPSLTHLYERETNRSSKRKMLPEEVDAAQTGKERLRQIVLRKEDADEEEAAADAAAEEDAAPGEDAAPNDDLKGSLDG